VSLGPQKFYLPLRAQGPHIPAIHFVARALGKGSPPYFSFTSEFGLIGLEPSRKGETKPSIPKSATTVFHPVHCRCRRRRRSTRSPPAALQPTPPPSLQTTTPIVAAVHGLRRRRCRPGPGRRRCYIYSPVRSHRIRLPVRRRRIQLQLQLLVNEQGHKPIHGMIAGRVLPTPIPYMCNVDDVEARRCDSKEPGGRTLRSGRLHAVPGYMTLHPLLFCFVFC
jgi:hypothetical protein